MESDGHEVVADEREHTEDGDHGVRLRELLVRGALEWEFDKLSDAELLRVQRRLETLDHERRQEMLQMLMNASPDEIERLIEG